MFTREKLLETARSLPSAPQILVWLSELLQDANSGLEEIADLLKRDTALAARIIRISNSVVYGGGGQIGSIEEAVNRVGFHEIYRLVGIATSSRLAERSLNYYRISGDALCSNILVTALACEELAKQSGVDGRVAYTAGLMRALGMIVLDRVGRDRLSPNAGYDDARFKGYSAWEANVFGFANPEVAALILAEWKFPAEIVSAVREQYVARASDHDDSLACILNIAGWIAAKLGHGLVGDARYWELTPKKLEGARVSEDLVNNAMTDTKASFERLQACLA
jgi:HD-like signal output (HDOD) protein